MEEEEDEEEDVSYQRGVFLEDFNDISYHEQKWCCCYQYLCQVMDECVQHMLHTFA